MLRYALATALLMVAPAAARADPGTLCGLEDSASTNATCPPYITYDEDGEEVSGARQS